MKWLLTELLFNRFRQLAVYISFTLVTLLTPMTGTAAPLCARLWMTSPALQAHKTNYQILGAEHEGPPIVLIHGVGSNLHTFDNVATQFARSHKVILYDLRGHGRTKDPEKGFEIETLTQDLENLLSSLEVKKFHVLGHSAGGKIAMNIAVRNPKRVLSVILEDIGPSAMSAGSLADYRDTSRSANFLRSLNKIYFSTAQLTRDLGALYPGDLLSAKDLAAKVMPVGPRKSAVTKQFWYEFKTTDATNFLHEFKGPALFLRAQPATRFLTDKDVSQIKRDMPSAQIVEVAEGSHSIHTKKPEAYVDQVSIFLSLHKDD